MSEETHIVDLLPAYALGCLEADEATEVAAHLAICAQCQAELHAYQATVDQVAFAAPDVSPPADLKDRLLKQVQPASPIPVRHASRSIFQRLTPLWRGAGLLLIIVLAVSNLLLWQRIAQLTTPSTEPDRMQAIAITGTDRAPEATGFVLVSADGQSGAVVVDKLTPLDEDLQYQLWLIRDGEYVSGATFKVDDKGYAGTLIWAPEPLFAYTAISITIEPVEGSTSPTGDSLLGGPLFPAE